MKNVRRRVSAYVVGFAAALRAALAAVRLLLDPSRLDEVFALDRGLSRRSVLEAILARIRTDPAGASALAERARFTPGSIAELRELPAGSLGRAYGDFLATHGLDPRAIPTLPVDDDLSYVQAHLYETHDLWHVVAGFDTDVAGEVGVQALYAAQTRGALPAVLISGALLQALVKEPGEWSARLEAVARGWTLGKQARPLFGAPWASLLRTPLDEVQRRYRLDLQCERPLTRSVAT